ncbi:ATP-binding protein [Dyella sp. 2RAB6]|uniref:ATP-binding protein n=1 Tax=Dyella sp. 2RAB6 TaxID=3232992 RepID=UPI003F91F93F
MARILKYTWVRLGIYVTLVIALTVAVLLSSLWALQALQLHEFLAKLPFELRTEMLALDRAGQDGSLRALEIYGHYWRDDPWYGDAAAVVFTLIICTVLASVVAFLLARALTRPMSSMADAAMRIASGDLAARADRVTGSGELVELVGHFNQMAASLEALEHERKETAAAIAHELRTPLAILQGRLHALCDEVIEGSSSEYQKLLGQVIHLGRLVEDLRVLSLSEAGRLSLQCVSFDLAALVEEHLQVYVALAQRRGIRTDLRTEPATVTADPDRVRQILSNLFDNVLRYAASGGLLRVAVSKDERWAILQVRDAGPGLPERLKARLTVSAYRERATLAAKVDAQAEGSGLGLAMVRSLVQQHGGRLQVRNAATSGTVFTISLPLAALR